MKMTNKNKKRVKSLAMLALLGVWALDLQGTALAAEAAKFKESESTFYSDLFDQNIYNEGMSQLDFGRWGRKLSGKALPSKNVNVFDEVPDSGFFTNRHGRERLSAVALEKGYQETSGPDLSRPLEVISRTAGDPPPFYDPRRARGRIFTGVRSLGAFGACHGRQDRCQPFLSCSGYFVPQVTILLVERDQFRAASGATTWEDTGFQKP
jgi:hypothetical protein